MPVRTVAIVGLGYVGLPLAVLASDAGYAVTGIEYDTKKAKLISSGISPFVDNEVSLWLSKNKLKASSGYEAVDDAQIIIMCVPTPVDKHHNPDLTPIIE